MINPNKDPRMKKVDESKKQKQKKGKGGKEKDKDNKTTINGEIVRHV